METEQYPPDPVDLDWSDCDHVWIIGTRNHEIIYTCAECKGVIG